MECKAIMSSNEFIWSFISRIDRVQAGKEIEASFLFDRDLLAQLGAPRDQEFVPEGLILECCAQSSGFILLAELGNLDFVPVLARVSEAEFYRALEVGKEAQALCEEVHRNENGAEFQCEVREKDTREIIAKSKLLLGFTPLDRVPDGGQGIRTHLERLKRQLQLA
jgi:3-hydroxymyristoyl/3-hydroxydecanoyl-(acyl carrier protein) dehydratase